MKTILYGHFLYWQISKSVKKWYNFKFCLPGMCSISDKNLFEHRTTAYKVLYCTMYIRYFCLLNFLKTYLIYNNYSNKIIFLTLKINLQLLLISQGLNITCSLQITTNLGLWVTSATEQFTNQSYVPGNLKCFLISLMSLGQAFF